MNFLHGTFSVGSTGDGPFPGVVEFPGGAPGFDRHWIALLASRGIAALSIPYFRVDDWPRNEVVLNLECVEVLLLLLLAVDRQDYSVQ